IALAERLVADYPAESVYRLQLGHIHDFFGQHLLKSRPEAAAEELRKGGEEDLQAATLDPDNAIAFNFRAYFLANSPVARFRKPDQAIAWANRALALAKGPDRGRIWTTLGVAYYRKGDWRAAITALEMSCQLTPGGGRDDDFIVLAMAHWQLGKRAE